MKDIDLTWREEYVIGEPKIDKAHMEIFQIAALFLANEQGRAEAAKEAFEFMRAYVLRHFAEEEEFMRERQYPAIEAHAKEHADFRDNILPAIGEKLDKSGYSDEAINEFTDALVNWLKSHIMRFDMTIKFIDIL